MPGPEPETCYFRLSCNELDSRLGSSCSSEVVPLDPLSFRLADLRFPGFQFTDTLRFIPSSLSDHFRLFSVITRTAHYGLTRSNFRR